MKKLISFTDGNEVVNTGMQGLVKCRKECLEIMDEVAELEKKTLHLKNTVGQKLADERSQNWNMIQDELLSKGIITKDQMKVGAFLSFDEENMQVLLKEREEIPVEERNAIKNFIKRIAQEAADSGMEVSLTRVTSDGESEVLVDTTAKDKDVTIH